MAKIRVAIDECHSQSKDMECLNAFAEKVRAAGHEVITHGRGPNRIQGTMLSKSNECDIMVQIACGQCVGTLGDFIKGCTEPRYYYAKKGSIPIWTYGWTDQDPETWKPTGAAHDWGGRTQSVVTPYLGKTQPEVYNEHSDVLCGWSHGDTGEELATMFLKNINGGTSGTGGGTSASGAVEGMLLAGKGTTPQHWNSANYTPYTEIQFTNFEITEENPRIKTATFETPRKIDLTTGRVAVLITGDCNDFGGIILSREYDTENRLYKYQCQGFMDRIMANPVYVVANGSKTAHELITEALAQVGLPDLYLGEADDYDTAVTEETRELLEADKELTETSDMFKVGSDTVKKVNTKNKSSSSSSDGDEDDDAIKTVTKTESSTEDGKVKNTLKRKPVGIYDKDTMGDFIRTLLYDYGINVDFYGDINGIPHFEVMDFEAWLKTGWYISPQRGFEEDYTYKFDITNIITQVGVKNIQASSGEGELYTSEELLGVNLENFVGRMGTIVDNPSADTTVNEDETEVEQVITKYQDSSGREYNKTDVLETNGEPSCNKCASYNGGLKPTMKKYEKCWHNKCPGCKKEGTLKDASANKDYYTQCTNCKKEYCQFCGYERKNGNYQLTELIKTETVDTSSSDDKNESKVADSDKDTTSSGGT